MHNYLSSKKHTCQLQVCFLNYGYQYLLSLANIIEDIILATPETKNEIGSVTNTNGANIEMLLVVSSPYSLTQAECS